MMDYFVANSSLAPAPTGIQSTAGAVPVRNEKGETSMKKVKVHRYVSGKRPDYAPADSSSEESEDDDFLDRRRPYEEVETVPDIAEIEEQLKAREQDDPRLRRLIRLQERRSEEREVVHRRHIQEPEILENNQSPIRERIRLDSSESSEDEEDDISDEEKERRREELKKRVLSKAQDEELIKEEDDEEKSGSSSESSSEYEEYTDSEEETGPRLKPVFVLKKDRITVMEKEKEQYKQKQAEAEAKKLADEKKKQSFKMVEDLIKKEGQVKGGKFEIEGNINDIVTDDENDELDYETWKLRELKRNKRNKEEREAIERERLETERLRNMTEEERRQEARINPKVVTNKAAKGKYKFLQKYYHRGVYYLDKDDSIFKRDFSGATLEDHFNKTVLPKVMQCKNFGRSGRTKYTHLVDQDTTQFDSPWISDTAQNIKFHTNLAAGVKPVFDRPSLKRKKDF